MSGVTDESEPAFHLFLDVEETSAAAGALKLLSSDEAHQPKIRDLARRVLDGLAAAPGEHGVLTLPLTSQEMKVTHTAVRLLNDLQRGQDDERQMFPVPSRSAITRRPLG